MGIRMALVAIGNVFAIAFLFCYVRDIAPTHHYEGFVTKELPAWAWAFAGILSSIPLLWLPVRFSRPSDCAPWFLYFCVVSPTCLLSFLLIRFAPSEMLFLPISIVAAFGLFEVVRRQAPLLHPGSNRTNAPIHLLLPVVMILVSAVQLSFSNYRFETSLDDVYVRRMASREIIPNASLLNYIIAISNGVCIPLSIVLALDRKRWLLVIPVVLSALSTFSFSGQKSILFVPVLLAAIVLVVARYRDIGGLCISALFLGILLLAIGEALWLDTTFISNYIVRRMMAMPAQMTAYYWNYFSNHPYVMLTDNWFVSRIVGSRYDRSTPFLIGWEYFSSNNANANANIWASGFAHFGYLGMFACSYISATIMRIADGLGRDRDCFVAGSVVCAAIALVWVNGALHTSLLSNGVLAILLALYFIPREPVSSLDGAICGPLRDSPRDRLAVEGAT